jgi:opacity protein-like surface antigen
MKKILIICAMVALGAASSSVQARPSPTDDPAAAAIRALDLGQVYNQSNATRSPDNAPGACYRERPLDAWGFNFRLPQRTVC